MEKYAREALAEKTAGIVGVGYLISFSTEIETLDMSDFKTGNALEKLVQFLRMSFHGGMDATAALNLSLKLLKKSPRHDNSRALARPAMFAFSPNVC